MISALKPKVIGIDSFFDCKEGKTDSLSCPLAYDTLSNLILANAITEAGNVVLVTKLLQSSGLIRKYGDSDLYDSLERTDSLVRGDAIEGYASLNTGASHQEDLKMCRSFNPRMVLQNGDTLNAFSVQVAMLYDSTKAMKFLERGKSLEVINYRGNVPDIYQASAPEFANRYTYLEWYQPFDTTSFLHEIITDRIVLLGFMGENLDDTSWDDKFITPLNKNFAGKTRPDMYGVVVHANIISMILGDDYIDELAKWQEYAIAILICYFNIILFYYINQKIPIWFDGLSVLLQLVQIVVFTFIMIYALKWFNFKLNLTVTLLAIALVGTCFEVYFNLVKVLIGRFQRRFTKAASEVLTTQNSEISNLNP
ncbi:MAG: CHASE2 domain-containing protein [Bacteroidia bacterium]|nr:CHASE2 domain-containing protein [Bacteroidia bacterium]